MPPTAILGIIPARYASQRFPGKPLAQLCGLPVVQHTYRAALRCSSLTDVLIATDDDRIARVARDFGADVVMTDPACPSGSDRAAEAMRAFERRTGQEVLAVVNIQGDEPMIDPAVVDGAVAALLAEPPAGLSPNGVSTAMTPIRDAAMAARSDVVKVVTGAGSRALYFSRSPLPCLARSSGDDFAHHYAQELAALGWTAGTPCYGFKHLGLYAFRRAALLRFIAMPPSPLEQLEKLEQLRLLEAGIPIAVIATPHEAPGIDTPEELARAEAIMRERGGF